MLPPTIPVDDPASETFEYGTDALDHDYVEDAISAVYTPGLILRDRIESLQIVNKEIGTIPFKMNWAQRDMHQLVEFQLATTGKIRIIVLKARQIGISTYTEALAFTIAMLIEYYRVLIVGHERDAAEGVLAMTKHYWDHYPLNRLWTPQSDSRYELSWKELHSSIKIATAGKRGSAGVGRSKTTHFQHITEIAFWADVETVMLSLNQTLPEVPFSACIIESTANGIGNWFHSKWEEAVAGGSDYIPRFYPWWKHPEYTAEFIGLPDWDKPLKNLDELEDIYRRKLKIDDNRLRWRRWFIPNKCNGDILQFMQEYPATPEEAFISTGLNVWAYTALKKVYAPEVGFRGMLERDGDEILFKQDEPGTNEIDAGKLTIFRLPNPNTEKGVYVIAGDPTRTTQGDFACVQVFNRRTLEQVAVYRAKIDPVDLAEEMFKLGIYYNAGLMTCECEGSGYATMGALVKMGYPDLAKATDPTVARKSVSSSKHGWHTNVQTKHLAVGWMRSVVNDRAITLHHEHTFTEMKNYVTKPDGQMGPADEKNGHDDTVMSACIAITTHILDGVLDPYKGAAAMENIRQGIGRVEGLQEQDEPQEPDWTHWRVTQG